MARETRRWRGWRSLRDRCLRYGTGVVLTLDEPEVVVAGAICPVVPATGMGGVGVTVRVEFCLFVVGATLALSSICANVGDAT